MITENSQQSRKVDDCVILTKEYPVLPATIFLSQPTININDDFRFKTLTNFHNRLSEFFGSKILGLEDREVKRSNPFGG